MDQVRIEIEIPIRDGFSHFLPPRYRKNHVAADTGAAPAQAAPVKRSMDQLIIALFHRRCEVESDKDRDEQRTHERIAIVFSPPPACQFRSAPF